MAAQPANKDVGFFPSLTLQKDIEQLRNQTGLLNAQVTGIQAKIEKVEMSMAIINKEISNSGTQIFSGDIGITSLIVICFLLGTSITTYFQFQIAKLRKIIEKTDEKLSNS